MKKAPLVARYLAFLIDVGFIAIVVVLLFVAALAGYFAGMDGGVVGRSATIRPYVLIFICFKAFLCLFYFTYLSAYGESTLGKSIFGLRVVRRRDGENIGFARSFVRAVCYLLSAYPLFAGFFLAFLLKGRALHDILTGTEVVKEG